MSVVTRSVCWEGCCEHGQYRGSGGGQGRGKCARPCTLTPWGNLGTAPSLCPLYETIAWARNGVWAILVGSWCIGLASSSTSPLVSDRSSW